MFGKVFLLLAFVALAAASPFPPQSVLEVKVPLAMVMGLGAKASPELLLGAFTGETGNANFYMDLVLANLNRLLPERVDLPDFGTAINMHQCYMFGLDGGLDRVGDATMVTIEDTVKFTCEVATAAVGMSCRWKYLLMGGQATGTTDLISISTGFSVPLTSGSSPSLTEFRVTEMAPIKTDITGLTILFNWLVEDIADMIINDFADQMINVIETIVKDLMNQVLATIVMP